MVYENIETKIKNKLAATVLKFDALEPEGHFALGVNRLHIFNSVSSVY